MSINKQNQTVIAMMLVVAFSAFGTGCAKYKLKIQDQANTIKDLKKDKSDLEKEIEALEAAVAKLTESEKNLLGSKGDLELTVEKLNQAIDEKDARIQEIESEIEALNMAKGKLSKDLAAKKKLLMEMKKKEALAKKRLGTLKKILSQFKSLIKSGKLNVKIRRGKMVLELPSAILFESGKADLSDDGKKTLAEIATVLVKIRKREFQVAGHTDNVPIKSAKFASNWELSTARAVTVVKFLQENRMNPKNLSAAGYSEYQPESSNKSDQGKALNRRIEIVLMPNLDELPDLTDLEKELKK